MLYCLLQGCARNKNLAAGKQAHSIIVRHGWESNSYLGSALIQVFAAGGSLVEADQLFESIREQRSAQIWQAIICAHSRYGDAAQAVKLYGEMKQSGIQANYPIYVAVIKACSCLKTESELAVAVGKEIHADVTNDGYDCHPYVGSSLIHMYSKAGDVVEARKVFDRLPKTDVALWNTMIQGYAVNGLGQKALELFQLMQQQVPVVAPDHVTYLGVLRACGNVAALEQGRLTHAGLVSKGLLDSDDLIVGNSLVEMYAKCRSLDEAVAVFQRLSKRDIVSWNSLIRGFCHDMRIPEALQLFQQMGGENDVEPDSHTLVSILKACGDTEALDHGRLIHRRLVAASASEFIKIDVVVGNNLVDMYVKCGSLDAARDVFRDMKHRDALSWKAIIGGYVQNGREVEAIELFQQMQQDGVEPDRKTLGGLVKACSSLAALDQGKQLHNLIIQRGLSTDVMLGNTLVHMYGTCNRVDEAQKVFSELREKTVVSWTAMVGGLARNGHGQEAIALFQQMQQEGKVTPNAVTYVNVLKACASVGALQQGKAIHEQVVQRGGGLESNAFVANVLMNMYFRCGCVSEAQRVFDKLLKRDVMSWSVMIGGYAEAAGHGLRALELYRQMRCEHGVEASKATFLGALKACGRVPDLDQGRMVHAHVKESGLCSADVDVANTLIDMYGNCGSLEEARDVFDNLAAEKKSVVSWTAMIGVYALHGCGRDALLLFTEMQKKGFEPDDVTLLCVLTACSHAGLVEEGYLVFRSMFERFGITPGAKQYACMIDILCRAGHLSEAEELVDEMMPVTKPQQANVWMAVLGACQVHGNLELGRRAFDCVVAVEPGNAGAHVAMANLYAAAGRLEDKAEILSKMVTTGVRKDRGNTWVHLDNEVQSFAADDADHPRRREAYDALKRLREQVRLAAAESESGREGEKVVPLGV